MTNNGDKQHLDQPSYGLGLKDGRTEALIEVIEIARNNDKETTLHLLEKLLDECE